MMIYNMIKKRIHIIILLAIMLLVACEKKVSFEEAFPGLKDVGVTNDMTPVEIILRSKHKSTNGHMLTFSIPKAYLRKKRHWKGGEQEDLEIQTGLPDLLPRPAVKKNRKQPGEPGYEEAQIYADNGMYIYKKTVTVCKQLYKTTGSKKS